MNKRQVKKSLEAADMDMSAVVSVASDEVEIFVDDGNGRGNREAVEAAYAVASKALGWKGGYWTGCGGFVLQESPLDIGNWNSPASRWHY